MRKNIGADTANQLAGLQIDLLSKYRQGQITLGHLEWFLNLNRDQRERLLTTANKSDLKYVFPGHYYHVLSVSHLIGRAGLLNGHADITDENFPAVHEKSIEQVEFGVFQFEVSAGEAYIRSQMRGQGDFRAVDIFGLLSFAFQFPEVQRGLEICALGSKHVHPDDLAEQEHYPCLEGNVRQRYISMNFPHWETKLFRPGLCFLGYRPVCVKVA